MKKVVFDISDELAEQIEEMMFECGFSNRTEFFRYLAIEFIQRNMTPEKRAEREEELKRITTYNIPPELIYKNQTND
jgi:metal-responsive CopG/Arc/MetJ family transcriptional regulator